MYSCVYVCVCLCVYMCVCVCVYLYVYMYTHHGIRRGQGDVMGSGTGAMEAGAKPRGFQGRSAGGVI